jgi:small subunit ribosomal protein S6
MSPVETRSPVMIGPRGGTMRKYEAACIFRADEEKFKAAKEEVQAVLTSLGAASVKENDMGVRTLAYQIDNELQGHYLVFECEMEPESAHQIEDKVKYFNDLLRILVVRKDD